MIGLGTAVYEQVPPAGPSLQGMYGETIENVYS